MYTAFIQFDVGPLETYFSMGDSQTQNGGVRPDLRMFYWLFFEACGNIELHFISKFSLTTLREKRNNGAELRETGRTKLCFVNKLLGFNL